MKVGSLVVCINNSKEGKYQPMIVPQLEPTVYIVRDIVKKGQVISCRYFTLVAPVDGIYLEEIVNIPHDYGAGVKVEPYYSIVDFREVLPPAEGEEVLTEALTVLEPQLA